MQKPGAGGDAAMGPNLASVQSLLNATHDRMGDDDENSRSALAVMNAVLATPAEALKSDVVGNMCANLDKAVLTLGANLPAQFSIFSPSKTSLAFGFPILFESMQGGEGGGDDMMGGDGAVDAGGDSDERLFDGRDDPSIYDPWHFDQYPHTDETIGRAAHGLEDVQYAGGERGAHYDYSPSPSPDSHDHDTGRGM
ncbi:hypothetical protein [Candidatus Anaplasma sp. TIGMIC]|uniref:hypothetical protein n=1 Tax=Candidatus Anaplasma sp. TIGMIC TaxID=3020713 RepID=UPI002330D55B|nr:hypothetical protein [Candidatus Anaplasma sp. TIGMIC]